VDEQVIQIMPQPDSCRHKTAWRNRQGFDCLFSHVAECDCRTLRYIQIRLA